MMTSVLVVEDDAVVLEITTRALERAGFETHSAVSGEDALEVLQARGDGIDWLMTDINLGGDLTGYSLGAEFHLRYPHRPVIYTSAAPLRMPALPASSLCLPKPFDPLAVVEHFRRLTRQIQDSADAKDRQRAARTTEPSAAPAPRADGRASPRLRSMLRGQVIFNNRFSTMDCVVRDLTETGARLELGGDSTLPPAFELYLPLRQKRYQVEMVWKRGSACGVRFLS
jgi:CheY-like chemotaxis protein